MQILLLIVLVVFLPVVFIAAFIPENEYAEQGIIALDCDSPCAVLIFAIPSSVVYSVGLRVFSVSYYKHRNIKYLLISLLCGFLLTVCTVKIIVALDMIKNKKMRAMSHMQQMQQMKASIMFNKNRILHLN